MSAVLWVCMCGALWVLVTTLPVQQQSVQDWVDPVNEPVDQQKSFILQPNGLQNQRKQQSSLPKANPFAHKNNLRRIGFHNKNNFVFRDQPISVIGPDGQVYYVGNQLSPAKNVPKTPSVVPQAPVTDNTEDEEDEEDGNKDDADVEGDTPSAELLPEQTPDNINNDDVQSNELNGSEGEEEDNDDKEDDDTPTA
ncbi:hypothetical protein KP79_PYT06239 [Mizuhopecten yessoensis]|uniref:Uncharacterized protein n=1 Tax=Mizuhopecten yessoensis TaxID=6573 RepID=A0A210QTL9_MIZYE|nr:hypothetical protein KP79_PYT06239 [Mizuhopecten yessoensis]